VDFAFTSDQQLLKNSARAFLDEHCKPAFVRSLMDDPRGETETMWKEMAQLGWLGLALPESVGGAGLGMVETAILLEELGRAACPSPYWPTMLAGLAIDAAGTAEQKQRWLASIAGGEARASVAFMEGELDCDLGATTTRADVKGTRVFLTGVKQFVPWAAVADLLVAPARGSEGPALYLVDPRASGVSITPLTGVDLGTRWATVSLDGAAAVPLGRPAEAENVFASLLRRAAVGAAAEMLGASRRCLDMAVAYAKVREQFGQPIGAFQAIRHKCADMLVEVENAHAATYYAAWALDADAEDAPLAASVAKAYVGDASRKVCGEAIQVHGGIGFTWEYDLHLYFKRAKALETMYGDADAHRALIARRVVE